MRFERMIRVSERQRCPVCGKPDWCLAAEDGSVAICARIEEGSVKRCGDAGWLHILRKDKCRPQRRRLYTQGISTSGNKAKTKGFEEFVRQYQGQLTAERLEELSTSLEVTAQSLRQLRIGFDGQAYTFPMSDAQNRIIGIRRRFPNGRKISLTGSKTGLFIPTALEMTKPLVICEGPTDTAAALDLGFNVIGRPSCNTGTELISQFVQGRRVVIVGDNDTPGHNGAEHLASKLVLKSPIVQIVYPPKGIKDLRRWKAYGLTSGQFQAAINASGVVSTKVSTKIVIRKACHGRC